MTPAADERFLFVHLQKTAGTTLRQRLAAMVGESALYPSTADGDAVGLTFVVDELLRRFEGRRDEIRIVFGHFPLCVAELLPGRFRTFTLLREPVERTLSYLRHHRETTPSDRQKSLEEIYEDPLRFDGMAHNHMTKMLSLTPAEMTDGMLTSVPFTPERLERARHGLDRIDVVGVSEDFESFCADLRRTFGWDVPDRPAYANRSTAVDVSDAFRRRIADDNADDIALYEYAVQQLAARARDRRRDGMAPRA